MSSEESNQDHLRLGERLVKSITDRLGELKEGIKTQPLARSFFYSYAERFIFTKTKNDIPAFVWQNPRSETLSIRKIAVIFDEEIANDTFAPFLRIKCNEAVIFESKEDETPFLKADLCLEYAEGKAIERHEKLEIFAWYLGNDIGDKKATVSLDVGES